MRRQMLLWTLATLIIVRLPAGTERQTAWAASANLGGNWNLRAEINVSPSHPTCSFLTAIGDPVIPVTQSDRNVIALDTDTTGQRFSLQGNVNGRIVDFTITGFGITLGSGQCSLASRNHKTRYSGTLSQDARTITGTVSGSAEYAFGLDTNGNPLWSVLHWTGTFTVAISSCVVQTIHPSGSQLVTIPNILQGEDGNGNSCEPFSSECPPGVYHSQTMRYQQVYKASEFGARGSEILMINEIRFRLNLWPFPAADYSDFQINFSTTTAEPGRLSLNFADNVGLDDAVVFRGHLILESRRVGSTDADFEVAIRFGEPRFLYAPALGNLLLDMRRLSSARLGSRNVMAVLDAHFMPNNSISRVFAGDANALTGFTESLPGGLVTGFAVRRVFPPICTFLP